MAEPFRFHTRLNLVELLGRRAAHRPASSCDGIREVPGARSIITPTASSSSIIICLPSRPTISPSGSTRRPGPGRRSESAWPASIRSGTGASTTFAPAFVEHPGRRSSPTRRNSPAGLPGGRGIPFHVLPDVHPAYVPSKPGTSGNSWRSSERSASIPSIIMSSKPGCGWRRGRTISPTGSRRIGDRELARACPGWIPTRSRWTACARRSFE